MDKRLQKMLAYALLVFGASCIVFFSFTLPGDYAREFTQVSDVEKAYNMSVKDGRLDLWELDLSQSNADTADANAHEPGSNTASPGQVANAARVLAMAIYASAAHESASKMLLDDYYASAKAAFVIAIFFLLLAAMYLCINDFAKTRDSNKIALIFGTLAVTCIYELWQGDPSESHGHVPIIGILLALRYLAYDGQSRQVVRLKVWVKAAVVIALVLAESKLDGHPADRAFYLTKSIIGEPLRIVYLLFVGFIAVFPTFTFVSLLTKFQGFIDESKEQNPT